MALRCSRRRRHVADIALLPAGRRAGRTGDHPSDAPDALGGALAIVSGRRVEEIDRFLRLNLFPASGVHGAQIRFKMNGQVEPVSASPRNRSRMAATALAAGFPALFSRTRARRSPFTGAAPAAGRRHPRLASSASGAEELSILRGHCVFEIKRASVNKGVAVAPSCANRLRGARLFSSATTSPTSMGFMPHGRSAAWRSPWAAHCPADGHFEAPRGPGLARRFRPGEQSMKAATARSRTARQLSRRRARRFVGAHRLVVLSALRRRPPVSAAYSPATREKGFFATSFFTVAACRSAYARNTAV